MQAFPVPEDKVVVVLNLRCECNTVFRDRLGLLLVKSYCNISLLMTIPQCVVRWWGRMGS